jgi:2-hydroxychromene-2-carboxylate isomerase
MMGENNRPTLQFYYDVSPLLPATIITHINRSHARSHTWVRFGMISPDPLSPPNTSRVEALARRTDVDLIWTPVLLGAIYRETAAPQGAAGSASDVFNPTKKRVISQALRRTLQRNNVEVKWPSVHPRSPVLALRLLHHLPAEDRPKLSQALYRAYWVDDLDITDKSVLMEIARKCGIPQISESIFSDKDAHAALYKATAEVIARGAPGLPSFWVAGEQWVDEAGKSHQGRLYWGQDRMHFVEGSLLALRNSCNYSQVPRVASLQPRCLLGPPVGHKKVEFWYDFSSPWAFLGWTQLERLKREFGPDVEIAMKPFLLGALFKM